MMTNRRTVASFVVLDLMTAHSMWACAVSAARDGDYEVAAYFAHMLADLAAA